MSSVNQPRVANLLTRWMATPLGPLEIGVKADPSEIPVYWYFDFKTEAELTDIKNADRHPLLDLAEAQFSEYFGGSRTEFSELLCHMSDYGTNFQQSVWQALVAIPFGDTWSYSQLAAHLNNPKAVRAVGAANGKNPLAIVVPCHRVIGANGTLTGYAGGLDKKQWLLAFEAEQTPTLFN